ncbi:23S rRNA (adenine(2030)-N(6))-methyltransferase RlmJ [Rhodoblastus sp. 17X3]|uniref:23S rRNA (adenine(2030)-N(6))-methyltransferase RlmJ n=1 Tax=Rhodoblastus sp. 17X3 TaxID=3047026 RepID=UPI0024B74749|nr:23S rRNA (adenine(2030)-N(6))-methyltransferase RlmJ [Rhodoblastus sp. 17X3]MDI9846854.1 23S rRNA (adenine(2030)-N(6))-methyltransferase RlmJ [Rhodoblastus sp. 17X3]
MNYRHEFHAGNFADVLKHAALTRALLYLRRKDKPFRVIDTHAGAGLYDLAGPEAARSNEAKDGILRLLDDPVPGAAGDLLAPYLDAVRAAGAPKFYPGSPLIAQALMRPQDRAAFCELLPQAAHGLRRALGRDARVKTIEIDGYTGLKAYVPPVERRGLVLIDPPFERRDEYERAFDSLLAGLRKWPGGTYMVWQPVKEPEVADAFCRAIAAEAPDCLRVDLQVEAPQPGRPLARTGLLIVHPPYVLEEELKVLLPALTLRLARGPGAAFFMERYGAA